MNTSLQLQKEKLRTAIKALRVELAKSPKEKNQLDVQITSRLLEMPELRDADTVLVYESYETEVDTHKLIEILHTLGKSVVVPHIESMEPPKMSLVTKTSSKDDTRSQVKSGAIQCAVIPGLAFDAKLNRIGFGKGFFDNLLIEMTCPKIALAYDFQIVQNVPVCKHDEKVTHIITPTKIYE